MKTSVIEVRGMLSALSAHGVEKRIGKVPGVESVTVNYVAGSATVRYDDTRLEIADIKAAVHHCGYQCAGESLPRHVSDRNPAHKRALVPTPEAAPASASPPVAAVAKVPPVAPAAVAVPAAPAVVGAAAVPAPAAPAVVAPAAVPAPAAPAIAGHEGHAAPGAQPSTPVAAVAKVPPVAPAAVAVPAAPAVVGAAAVRRRLLPQSSPPPPCQRRPLPQSPVTRATRRPVPSLQRPQPLYRRLPRSPPPPCPHRPLPQSPATRATRRRVRRPPCRRIWRTRWAMAGRTCRPWSATCATVSGSA